MTTRSGVDVEASKDLYKNRLWTLLEPLLSSRAQGGGDTRRRGEGRLRLCSDGVMAGSNSGVSTGLVFRV